MASLEMLSGRSKKEYAKEAEAVASGEPGPTTAPATDPTASNGTAEEPLEAVVAM